MTSDDDVMIPLDLDEVPFKVAQQLGYLAQAGAVTPTECLVALVREAFAATFGDLSRSQLGVRAAELNLAARKRQAREFLAEHGG